MRGWKVAVVLGLIAAAWWYARRWFADGPEPAPEPKPAGKVLGTVPDAAASPGKVLGAVPDAGAAVAAPLAGLFVPGPVRAPGPLASLPIDASLDEIRRLAPGLIDAEVTDPRWPGVAFTVDGPRDEDGRLLGYDGGVVVFRSETEAVAAIEPAWGPATRGVWFNPDEGIRAVLRGGWLHFQRYLPVAKLLEMDPHGELPPTEWELGMSPMTLQNESHLDGQRLSYTLHIPYEAHPAAREEILAAFEKKWGQGERTADGIRWVDGPIEITADDSSGNAWYLRWFDRALYERIHGPR